MCPFTKIFIIFSLASTGLLLVVQTLTSQWEWLYTRVKLRALKISWSDTYVGGGWVVVHRILILGIPAAWLTSFLAQTSPRRLQTTTPRVFLWNCGIKNLYCKNLSVMMTKHNFSWTPYIFVYLYYNLSFILLSYISFICLFIYSFIKLWIYPHCKVCAKRVNVWVCKDLQKCNENKVIMYKIVNRECAKKYAKIKGKSV